MGLDVSHNAFSAPYSAFNRFRSQLLAAAGGKWPSEDGGYIDFGPMDQENYPGLWALFCHSDCEGEMTVAECAACANEMEALLPKLSGELLKRTQQWIDGCRAAVAENEPLEFS